jgi:hypothetical protein
VTLVNAAAEDLNIPAAADAMLFCATHDVLSSPQALSTVFRHARPGARVAATGGKWAAPWLWPLNLLAVQLQAPFVSSFDGFDRPWRHLAAYCSELAVRPIAWGIGFLATGTAAGMIPPLTASRHGAAPQAF